MRAALIVRVTRLMGVVALGLALCPIHADAQGTLQYSVDAPTANSTVSEPFTVSGWSFYDGSTSGTGIDVIHVQGCPVSNCASQTYWGAATLGLSRPDVAAYFNNAAGANSGFTFTMSGLAPDTYHMEVWIRRAATGGWYLIGIVQMTVTSTPEHYLDTPTMNQPVTQPFNVTGWAIDASQPTGTGVDAVHVWAYRNFGNGTPQYMLGAATYGVARSDVAAVRGSRYLNSGYSYTLAANSQPPGWYMFLVSSHSNSSGAWTTRTVNAYVDINTVSLTISRSGTGTGGISATGLTCPGGSTTQAMPCGASYPLGTVVTLTAMPDAGSTYTWGGNCTGAGASCAVSLAGGDRSTFITFTKTPTSVTTNYYHTDMIGSVRAITDQAGGTVIRHDYYPFGEDPQVMTVDPNPMRFGGKELDTESALMNFEARYYRNTWGRFTQVDPVGGNLGDTQSWNRYAYGHNNPLRFVDPTGMCDSAAATVSADGVIHGTCGPGLGSGTDSSSGGGGSGSGSEYFSQYGMTPSNPYDLGPYGCGWTPDRNGNFYMWDSGCSQPTPHYTQQDPTDDHHQEDPKDPKDPDDPCKTKKCGGSDPDPVPSAVTKLMCTFDVGLDTVISDSFPIYGVVTLFTGSPQPLTWLSGGDFFDHTGLINAAAGAGSWFRTSAQATYQAAGGDAALNTLSRQTANGSRRAAAQLANVEQKFARSVLAEAMSVGLNKLNMVSRVMGCLGR